jgi:hypothetical protein
MGVNRAWNVHECHRTLKRRLSREPVIEFQFWSAPSRAAAQLVTQPECERAAAVGRLGHMRRASVA